MKPIATAIVCISVSFVLLYAGYLKGVSSSRNLVTKSNTDRLVALERFAGLYISNLLISEILLLSEQNVGLISVTQSSSATAAVSEGAVAEPLTQRLTLNLAFAAVGKIDQAAFEVAVKKAGSALDGKLGKTIIEIVNVYFDPKSNYTVNIELTWRRSKEDP